MWVQRGHFEFHPSTLSQIRTIRIEKPMIKPPQLNREVYSGTSVLRMRYRGPVESYKMNKAKSDIFKDLFILRRKINYEHQRLAQYVNETLNGSKSRIIVKEFQEDETTIVLHDGSESKQLEMTNHRLTATLGEG